MGKHKSKQRQHKLIGFKAYMDTDADLLEWWESIEPGDRSEALRDLMRLALGYPPHRTKRIANLAAMNENLAWMREALNDLPGYVERVIQHVAAVAPWDGAPAGNGIPRTSEVSDDAVQRREQRMKKAKW